MIRNVLKPDGTVHIEQQVANMRYDLTTGQVETVVPGAGATNLVFGADGRQHVELTTGNIRRNLGRPGFDLRASTNTHRHTYARIHKRTTASAPIRLPSWWAPCFPTVFPIRCLSRQIRGITT